MYATLPAADEEEKEERSSSQVPASFGSKLKIYIGLVTLVYRNVSFLL